MISPRFFRLAFLLLGLLGSLSSVRAVETVINGTNSFNSTNTISSSVTNWSTGWGSGAGTNTGWNYVGTVSDASGVYLGNDWVITAAHVNSPNSFTLNGNVYNSTGVSYSNFTNALTGTTNADIYLFQISNTSTTGTNLTLPSLAIATNAPSVNGKVVMIGYGGASGQGSESWATNKIDFNNVGPVSVNQFESIDFVTPNSGTNYGTLVNGDSGGGDFVNVTAGTNSLWQLVGLNEAVNSSYSFFVQLSTYESQISGYVNAVPEPSTWALLGLGAAALVGSFFRRKRLE